MRFKGIISSSWVAVMAALLMLYYPLVAAATEIVDETNGGEEAVFVAPAPEQHIIAEKFQQAEATPFEILGRAQNQFVSPGFAIFHIGIQSTPEELEQEARAEKKEPVTNKEPMSGVAP